MLELTGYARGSARLYVGTDGVFVLHTLSAGTTEAINTQTRLGPDLKPNGYGSNPCGVCFRGLGQGRVLN